MRASLKKKTDRFSLKTCRGEKAQQSWGETVAERNKDMDGGVGGQNKKRERKEKKKKGKTDETNVQNRGCY